MSRINDRAAEGIPLFLLKTKSLPNDGYAEQFSAETGTAQFDPIFVPVLEHRFFETALMDAGNLLQEKRIRRSARSKYGGMIFTSQRAVEAFARLVEGGMGANPSVSLRIQHF